MSGIEPIQRLVNQLSKLPGVGQKTAQRLAYYIISLPEEQVRSWLRPSSTAKSRCTSAVCGNYTDKDPARCVRHSARPVHPVRGAGPQGRGRHGADAGIQGAISRARRNLPHGCGVGPDDIRIRELIASYFGQIMKWCWPPTRISRRPPLLHRLLIKPWGAGDPHCPRGAGWGRFGVYRRGDVVQGL